MLVGSGGFDDAGVYKLSDDLALVQTVDFFTPIVDDPFDFGRIAAANALSDIYAMGAKPITALAVCAFPSTTLDLDVLRDTLAGGLEILKSEGVASLGGHTVKGPEFTYGLAVTGTVHPSKILTNSKARVGDELWISKPLGTGVLATALKRGFLAAEHERILVEMMAETNRRASEVCIQIGVHALTDVTGFGLLGHGLEMADASGVRLEINAEKVPLLPWVREAVEAGAVPGGLLTNKAWIQDKVIFSQVDEITASILCDPQTSGGLLLSVAEDKSVALRLAFEAAGMVVWQIGRVAGGSPGTALIIGR